MFSLIEEMLFTNARLCSSNLNYARGSNSILEKGYLKHFTKIHEQSLRCLIFSNKQEPSWPLATNVLQKDQWMASHNM